MTISIKAISRGETVTCPACDDVFVISDKTPLKIGEFSTDFTCSGCGQRVTITRIVSVKYVIDEA